MTVKKYIFIAVAVLAATGIRAAITSQSELFPGIDAYTKEEIRWQGLARLYPQRVRFESPELHPNRLSGHATRIEDLPRSIKYIRVYRLDEALKTIETQIRHPALLLDFRYLKSTVLGVELAAMLGCQSAVSNILPIGNIPRVISHSLRGSDMAVVSPRSTPIVVLCNEQTEGPFEAILHNLQHAGAIILVGEATTGHTGYYKKIGNTTWVLEGELRPTPSDSLVGVGVTPRIKVATSAEQSYINYHLYEAGTPIQQLLNPAKQHTPDSSQPASGSAPRNTDVVLQRGTDIVAALQILQQPHL